MNEQASETTEAPSRLSSFSWFGWGLMIFAVAVLVGFVAVSGNVFQADTVGEDDAGVVHPQPLGVDDDIAG